MEYPSAKLFDDELSVAKTERKSGIAFDGVQNPYCLCAPQGVLFKRRILFRYGYPLPFTPRENSPLRRNNATSCFGTVILCLLLVSPSRLILTRLRICAYTCIGTCVTLADHTRY